MDSNSSFQRLGNVDAASVYGLRGGFVQGAKKRDELKERVRNKKAD